MTEYSILFQKFNLFIEEVDTYFDFFTADDKEEAKSMCLMKHGENIQIEEVEEF